jgi:hypothetical protein
LAVVEPLQGSIKLFLVNPGLSLRSNPGILIEGLYLTLKGFGGCRTLSGFNQIIFG